MELDCSTCGREWLALARSEQKLGVAAGVVAFPSCLSLAAKQSTLVMIVCIAEHGTRTPAAIRAQQRSC